MNGGRKSERLLLVFLLTTWFATSALPHRSRQDGKSAATVGGHAVVRLFNMTNSPLLRPTGRFLPGAILEDAQGRLWVSDRVGARVHVYDWSTGQWHFFSGEPRRNGEGLHYDPGAILPGWVHSVVQSLDGTLWFAPPFASQDSDSGGPRLTAFDGRQWRNVSPPLVQRERFESVGLLADRKGAFWFWQADELVHHDAAGWGQPIKLGEALREPKSNLNISAAVEDYTGRVWLLTRSGLVRSDRTGHHWSRKERPADATGNAIYEDRQRRVWLAGRGCLYACDEGSEEVTRYGWPSDLWGPGQDEPNLSS